MSADGTLLTSTTSQPIELSDGFHCSDLGKISAIDASIAALHVKALFSMKEWLETWKPTASRYTVSSPRSTPQVSLPLPQVLSKPINAWFKDFGTF